MCSCDAALVPGVLREAHMLERSHGGCGAELLLCGGASLRSSTHLHTAPPVYSSAARPPHSCIVCCVVGLV